MMATPSRCSALVWVPFALVQFASASGCVATEPLRTQMTAQEIATAGNVALCVAGPEEVQCHGRAIADPNGCPHPNPAPAGFGPSQLRSAYRISGSGSASVTIAFVEAFGYANAEADLAVYRAQFGLPPCTTANGCFRKVNQQGTSDSFPPDVLGWQQETALDLDMVSAMCRNCRLLLVEANSPNFDDIAEAENMAASLGAHVINNSFGAEEYNAGNTYDYALDHPGVAIVASAGDFGYGLGVQWPSASPNIIAVGGTTLTTAGNFRGWTETAWFGSVSGCSFLYPKPAWQHDTGCTGRTVADVSAVADPNTGVAVYAPTSDTVPPATPPAWLVLGGTSVAAPIIAGIYGLNGGPVHYSSEPYAHTRSLFDVKSGVNGFCDPMYLCAATAGYDGPTGLGTPNGTGAF